MGIAIAVSLVVLFKIKKHFYSEISEEKIIDLSFLLIIFGILGARLWYVLLNLPFFMHNPLEIPMINHGGISIQGAVAAGIITGLIYTKKHYMSFLKCADLFVCVLPLGQTIGRWGNFFNSEAYGLPCDLPWKLFIPIENRSAEYINFEYFHPTFLYESILDFVIFLVLLVICFKQKSRKSGFIFFLYLVMYSLVRFCIEFMRTDSVLNIGIFPIAAIVCIVSFIVGVLGLTFISNKS
ncbi:MAG: prolipoprotein diacylglyceryl transferase, partial [Candidatus Gastranaerophilaceae bacterium]